MAARCDLDVLVFGGGIAGLWTLARLRHAGFACALLDVGPMGAPQSAASQGIIHGGVKYALLGEAGAASRALADMPARWRAALGGIGDVDLRAARTLSPCTHIWTTPGLVSRLAGLAASRVLRTAVAPLERGSWPEAYSRAPRGVTVYRVDEPVLDARSVLAALAAQAGAGAAAYARSQALRAEVSGGRAVITIGGAHVIAARHVVLLAGVGNQWLLTELRPLLPPTARMQVRPLHMVMARGALPEVFGHCLGASPVPRLTITTGAGDGGERVWYLGGQMAEAGVSRTREEQIQAARQELAHALGWIDLGGVRWATARFERAEGLTPGGTRPDLPVVSSSALLSVGWPSKLALAPLLADQVLERLRLAGVRPGGAGTVTDVAGLPAGTAALLPWNDASIRWT